MARLTIILDKCVQNTLVLPNGATKVACPYAGTAGTRGAGFAQDYFCKLTPDPKSEHGYRITSGYVEWDREINPVPNWCPLRTPENAMLDKLEE